MKQIKVYYGDNGEQEFWESDGAELVMFCNKGSKTWQGMIHGRCPDDPVLQPKAKEGSTFPLQGKTLEELIAKISDYFNIVPQPDGTMMFQYGSNKNKMNLVEV